MSQPQTNNAPIEATQPATAVTQSSIVMGRGDSNESMGSLTFSSEIGPGSRTDSVDSQSAAKANSKPTEKSSRVIVLDDTSDSSDHEDDEEEEEEEEQPLPAPAPRYVCGQALDSRGTMCKDAFHTLQERTLHCRYQHGKIEDRYLDGPTFDDKVPSSSSSAAIRIRHFGGSASANNNKKQPPGSRFGSQPNSAKASQSPASGTSKTTTGKTSIRFGKSLATIAPSCD